MYSTKCTHLGKNKWGCRVYNNDVIVVEAIAESRIMIGPTFRDLLRTIDKCTGGDTFTKAARMRKFKEGNLSIGVKHLWGGRK